MRQMTPTEVQNKLGTNEFEVVDVREVSEVAQGKIPGAIHIPLGLLEFRMNELDKNKTYVMVCRSGGRSSRASQFLDYYGYNVINMQGGMMAWEGPTE
ncbi:rhodanese-like domain-containing protein [Mesobacillus sp. AQ2]|jgi:rhodanese-related sulfurtransferase|uniref:rhodanese-like domain-containing protein n=1 Tax=Bacillaceae TaxID=186817 RepID=UPI0011A76345|nr:MULTISPECIES: rhodanese-like domain-containing protein [Bacillaceae]MCM3122041.1 rhodanese-like domain-containing protein [Mesobacillus sp. MER 33]MCM3232005.1 rhodanese-like domain-containing protein [Mesobacillus sp. MER 48]WHX38963.1 rhodanese-like domain-containing protein [Mesobacillus sp. AQ2]